MRLHHLGSADLGTWLRETRPSQARISRGVACDEPAFTYCQRPRREFYYENAIRACVSTVTHQVGVCIRGANKFDSKRSCREACVEMRRPSEQCSHAPNFMECNSGDVVGTWWHFDGESCRRWNFTSGLCPAHGGGGAFVSREECLATCVGRRGRSRLCRVSSRPDHCYSDQLRFPYFAVATEDGDERKPLHCLKVSSTNYHGNRCLVGDNRFRSMKACRMTCVLNRSETELLGAGAP
ncbi:amblin-like [Dermacentor variabilis]|uniref:amblin-like n=1 Tax=Dermacentor variabilis TaxID=34621 RepID=UPI003F5BBE4F